MKHERKIRRMISFFIILLVGTSIVYATSVGNIVKETVQKTQSFFYIDKEETYAGDTLTMTIDLSKVSDSEFKFTLSSNIEVKKVVSDERDGTSVKVDTNNNEMVITADKSELTVDKIQLYYQIPEDIAVGDSITFYASLSWFETTKKAKENTVNNTISENSIQDDTVIKEVKNEVENNEEEKVEVSEEIQVTITIIEKEETSQENQDNSTKDAKNTNHLTSVGNSGNTGVSVSKTSGGSASTTSVETVTYKGSYDNYLTNITVDGYTLTPNFSKTNHTYFLTVANEVESIDVDVEKSDSSASVTIYGNTSLQVGENKVLISVTAENGNVRTYRIYVTRESK